MANIHKEDARIIELMVQINGITKERHRLDEFEKDLREEIRALEWAKETNHIKNGAAK